MSTDEQNALSDAFVAQGCRYAVCAGVGCSSWDDSIDWAYLATDPDFNPPDSAFVLTSWHEGETLETVVPFFLNACFEGFAPERFVAVAVGGKPSDVEEVRRFLRSGSQ